MTTPNPNQARTVRSTLGALLRHAPLEDVREARRWLAAIRVLDPEVEDAIVAELACEDVMKVQAEAAGKKQGRRS